MSHLKYLKYLIRHKWFVFLAGIRIGTPLWQLIIHDWSKFTPIEWGPYVRWFYSDGSQEEFDRAWLHHQHTNLHHWQYWVLRLDDGSERVVKIPERYVKEMVADWAGAGRAIHGKWDLADWYSKAKNRMTLHPETYQLVDKLIASNFGVIPVVHEVRFAEPK